MALRMGDLDGRPGAVLRKGDPDSGGVLVVLRGRDGLVGAVADARRGWRAGLDARDRRGAGRSGGGGCLRRAPGRSSIRTSGCWSSMRRI